MIIIKQMNGSHIYSDSFKKEVLEFEKELNLHLATKKSSSISKDEIDSNIVHCDESCSLEFYYYFDPVYKAWIAFRTAIWIKVNHTAGFNIWLRVQLNDNGKKKICIFADRQLKSFSLKSTTFALPFLFEISRPIVWIEEKRVMDCSHRFIVEEMCNYVTKKDICNTL